MLPPAILLFILTTHPVQRAESLVPRLGAPSYAVRERVGQELISLGRAALPSIQRGLSHADPEISERCRRILPLAEVEAIRQRVAFLLEIPPKPVPDDVPGAREFLSATRDSLDARRLYVEIYVVHHALLECLEKAGEKRGEVFWGWVDKFVNPEPDDLFQDEINRAPTPRPVPARGDAALFLFLSSNPKVSTQRSIATRSSDALFLKSDAVRAAFGARDGSAMRQLLRTWLTGPRSFENLGAEANHVQEAFKLVGDSKLTEFGPFLKQIALDGKQWHVARAGALMALQKIGATEDVPAIVPLIDEGTSLGYGRECNTVLGDVALATCISLSGRKLNDFGFLHAEAGQKEGSRDPLHFGFPDSVSRRIARGKWNEVMANGVKR